MRGRYPCALTVLLALAMGAPQAGAAEAEETLTELVEILRREGVIDDAQYSHLAAKATAADSEKSWTDRVRLHGDARIRLESWWFEPDVNGNRPTDRHRGRYRIRLGGEAEVNEYVKLKFRIGTGGHDPRNSNQSFGGAADGNSVNGGIGLGFDSDPILIDRAYVQLTPMPGGAIPGGLEGWTGLEVGKVPNAYTWGIGKDLMLWDGDINMEGFNYKLWTQLSDEIGFFLNAGYYVIDENSGAKDPGMGAVQIGGHYDMDMPVKVGGRFSYYGFDRVDTAFETRSSIGGPPTFGGGSLIGGLSGNPLGDDFHVVETAWYLRSDCIDWLPLLVYGTYGRNLSASATAMAGEAGDVWSVGGELGEKVDLVKLGLMYGRLEANAFPGFFVDSDMFDGFTNRRGIAVYAVRQLLPNMDVGVTTFFTERIKKGPAFANSTSSSDRVRMQADLMVKF